MTATTPHGPDLTISTATGERVAVDRSASGGATLRVWTSGRARVPAATVYLNSEQVADLAAALFVSMD